MTIELREKLKNHNPYVHADLFQATVVSADPGTNVIIVAPEGQDNHSHLQGIHLSSTFAAALGFVETILPTIGTRVMCLGRADKRTLILGSSPYPESQGNITNPTLPNKAILGTIEPLFRSVHQNGYLNQLTKGVIHNNSAPTDTLPGEKVFSNEFGVMLGLFKLMATLKATELAQVQCHFLDDLVRIISHNFHHSTALGELKVFQDGKGIHLEMGATHKPLESLGAANDGKSGIEPINDTEGYNQFYKMSDDQLVMLERMKMFVGQLGQFVNLLIVNPAAQQHALNGKPPTTPDTGLLQVKASLDGTLVVRSVNGIYLEKTNWIRVPTRIRTPEDPTGDNGTTINYPSEQAYEFDKSLVYRNSAFLYYLQLRDYLAYINEELGYTNFNAQVKDFYVNNDKSKETPLQSITYIDQESGIAYTQTKSWISLMGNGGISLSDAWGSCISMEGGNIYIQPAKDLVVQPNRNLIGKIGGNTAIATRGEIDLSSTEGGMRIKTNNAQYLYSAQGGIVLHTDGNNFKNSVLTYNQQPNAMVVEVAGIVFKAPNSSVNSYAQQVYHNATDTYIATGAQITLDSTSVTRIMSDHETILYGDAVLSYSDSESITYSGGESIMLGLTSTIVGVKNQYFALAGFGDFEVPVQGLLDPKNNQDAKFFSALATQLNALDTFDVTTVIEAFPKDSDFDQIAFQFPPTALYNLDTVVDVIPETLSQQTNDINNLLPLQPWVETPINNSYPYPGKDFSMSLATVAVNNVEAEADLTLANKAVGLISKSKIQLTDLFKNYQSM